MTIQKACEILEEFLERDTKNKVLTSKEFTALNKVLLKCQVKLGYEVKDYEKAVIQFSQSQR